MEIKKLEWDSQFFGFPVGDVFIENESSFSGILNSNIFTFFQVRSESLIDIISDTHSLSHCETKTVFSKNLNGNSYVDISITDFDDEPIAENSFYNLAYESGKWSRYKQDKNIAEDKFQELYQLWIRNSINKSFASKFFYIKENENILAFVTFKINDNLAQIGLIAVSPNSQGKGLGKNILLKVENYCFQNNIKTLLIPTQLENEAACNFYLKMGYKISGKIVVKHFWKNSN